MTTARAQANHGLYLAKILLQSWQLALADDGLPARTLNQAFVPAVREHLLNAYGWFLLELSGADSAHSSGGKPPHSWAELADVAEGKVLPGEICEFKRLEAAGWLAQLQAAQQPFNGASIGHRSPGNLSVAASELPDCAQMTEWLNRLQQLFERMSDSLDEC